MPDIRHIPAVDVTPHDLSGFVQEIRLDERRTTIGLARWHVPPGEQGVVQILELRVAEEHRRRGLGSQLLEEVISQARSHHSLADVRFRRLWVSVEQKSQVIARAFLTDHGFHHVATVGNLVMKQDALIYVRAMD